MNSKSFHALIVVTVLFSAGGASCPRSRQIVNDQAPIVLSPQASLEDLIRVVNANSAQIQQVQSTGATLTVEGMPPLDASYALERPKRFRLRAETAFGPELDLGSNDEIFWMWVKRTDRPAVYWGRHDQFYQSAAREILPVPPDWLIEALGIVQLDPTGQHEGPVQSRPGQLEVRTYVRTPAGPLTKVTVIDDTRGWILEQHLYDAANQPVASAFATGFQYVPHLGVSLPRQVQIQLPAAELSFTLKTEQHLLNQLAGDPAQLWTMPQISGFQYVNLAAPGVVPAASVEQPLAVEPVTRYERRYADQRNSAIRRLPPFDRLR